MLSSFLANNFFFSSNRIAKESGHKQVAFAQTRSPPHACGREVVGFPDPPVPSALLHGHLRTSSAPVHGKRGLLEASVRSTLFPH